MVAWESTTSRRQYPWIAREGWPYLAAVVTVGGIFYFLAGPWTLLPSAATLAAVVFLLRDPPSRIPCDPLALVSPVQGSVVDVKTGVRDPWLEREASCIRIRVSPFDVFSLRSPTEGKVEEQWCSKAPGSSHVGLPGARLNGRSFQYAFWTRTDEDDNLITAVSAPCLPILHRLRVNLHTGDRVGQGHRIGYLLLGGEVEVWAPPDISTEVHPGDRVRSGCSILAHLVHRHPVSVLGKAS